jgi:catechol 2,3-dioxygenase-like lactoylglutathione lyase family enzyme
MSGIDRFACITVAVKDQEEALAWFTEKLGFVKGVDREGEGIRFLTVCPPKQRELQVILADWFPDKVGKNATAVVYTDDCRQTYEEVRGRGVEFTEGPERRAFRLQQRSRIFTATRTRSWSREAPPPSWSPPLRGPARSSALPRGPRSAPVAQAATPMPRAS